MTPYTRALSGVFALTLVTSIGLTVAPATARPITAQDAQTSPNSRGIYNRHLLTGVDLDSPSDGWAVGWWYGTGSDAKVLTRAKHWDGTSWTLVDSPNPGVGSTFDGVDAISPTDAWAVGGSGDGSETWGPPLIEHWDGTSWSAVAPQFPHGKLLDVDSSGPDDVWAVGFLQTPTFRNVPLTLHWDGRRWSRVHGPRTASLVFHSVDVIASDDVWAVGGGSLIEHWDGAGWSVVPANTQEYSMLTGVSAAAADDIWAVGYAGPSAGQHAIALHWDGSVWSPVHVPNGRGDHNAFTSVSAVSGTDVWAVGDRGSWAIHQSKTLIEHWDGNRWTRVFSPNRQRTEDGYDQNTLESVSAVAGDDAWAVGDFRPHQKTKPIIARWDGTRWANFITNK